MITTYCNIEQYRNISGIYYIINTVTHRKYIGSTTNLYKRYKEHSSKTHCFDLKKDLSLYGKESFIFKIVDVFEDISIEELEQKEQEHLNVYFAQEYIDSKRKDSRFRILLYNRCPRSSKRFFHLYTKETKALWSLQRKGKDNPRFGVILDEKIKKKISTAQKNKYQNGYINPKQGSKTTEETKERIKKAWIESGFIQKIFCLSLSNYTIRNFESYTEASRHTGVDSADIQRICKNKQLYSKDYYFSLSEITESTKIEILQHVKFVKEDRERRRLSKIKSNCSQPKIKITDLFTNIEYLFSSCTSASKFIGTNNKCLKKYLNTNVLRNKQYKIETYENQNI